MSFCKAGEQGHLGTIACSRLEGKPKNPIQFVLILLAVNVSMQVLAVQAFLALVSYKHNPKCTDPSERIKRLQWLK